jgi:hypothetical protein
VKLGAKIFGALAGVLILYLLLGLLLPGTWEAEIEAHFSAPPATVFPYLNRVDQWILWNPMPESGSGAAGAPQGVGAELRWDDPQYGRGSYLITVSHPNAEVGYEVEIEGGPLRIRGSIELTAEGSGTHLTWKEIGDFGRNPLMGYAARGMADSQAEAMRSSLQTLRRLLGEG